MEYEDQEIEIAIRASLRIYRQPQKPNNEPCKPKIEYLSNLPQVDDSVAC